jgi:hypothetical protein
LNAIGVFDEAKLRDADAHDSLVADMLDPSLKPLGADRVKKMGWENTGCMMKEEKGCALWEKAGFVA